MLSKVPVPNSELESQVFFLPPSDKKTTTTLERIFNNVREAIIGTLFLTSKSSRANTYVYLAEWFVHSMQVLAALSPASFGSTLGEHKLAWLFNFASFFTFDSWDFMSLSTTVYFCIGLVGLVLLNIAYVGYSWVVQSFNHMWSLRMLRASFSLVVGGFLYIPIVKIFVKGLTCSESEEIACSQMRPVCILLIILFIPFALLTKATVYNPRPDCHDADSMAHSRVELLHHSMHTVIAVMSGFLPKESIGLGDTITKLHLWVVIVSLMSGSVLISYIWLQPLFNHRYNVFHGFLLSVVFWTSVSLSFHGWWAEFSTTDSTHVILFYGGLVVLIPFVQITLHWRRFSLIYQSKIVRTAGQATHAAMEVELQVRMLLYQAQRVQSMGTDAEGVLKAQKAGTNLYREAVANLPESSLICVLQAQYLLSVMQKPLLARRALLLAESRKPKLDERFVVFKTKKHLEENAQAGGIMNFVMSEKHQQLSKAHDIKCCQLLADFWGNLSQPIPDLLVVRELAEQIAASATTAETSYRKVIQLKPHDYDLLETYAGFVENIGNDPEEAAKIKMRSRDLRNRADKAGPAVLTGFDNGSAILTVDASGGLDTGSILAANTEAGRVFNQHSHVLVGKRISSILLEPFANKFDDIVASFLDNGEENYFHVHYDTTYIKIAEESVVLPCRITLTPFTTDGINFRLYCFLKERPLEPQTMGVILVNPTTTAIIGSTSQVRAQLNLASIEEELHLRGIEYLIPDYRTARQRWMKPGGAPVSLQNMELTMSIESIQLHGDSSPHVDRILLKFPVDYEPRNNTEQIMGELKHIVDEGRLSLNHDFVSKTAKPKLRQRSNSLIRLKTEESPKVSNRRRNKRVSFCYGEVDSGLLEKANKTNDGIHTAIESKLEELKARKDERPPDDVDADQEANLEEILEDPEDPEPEDHLKVSMEGQEEDQLITNLQNTQDDPEANWFQDKKIDSPQEGKLKSNLKYYEDEDETDDLDDPMLDNPPGDSLHQSPPLQKRQESEAVLRIKEDAASVASSGKSGTSAGIRRLLLTTQNKMEPGMARFRSLYVQTVFLAVCMVVAVFVVRHIQLEDNLKQNNGDIPQAGLRRYMAVAFSYLAHSMVLIGQNVKLPNLNEAIVRTQMTAAHEKLQKIDEHLFSRRDFYSAELNSYYDTPRVGLRYSERGEEVLRTHNLYDASNMLVAAAKQLVASNMSMLNKDSPLIYFLIHNIRPSSDFAKHQSFLQALNSTTELYSMQSSVTLNFINWLNLSLAILVTVGVALLLVVTLLPMVHRIDKSKSQVFHQLVEMPPIHLNSIGKRYLNRLREVHNMFEFEGDAEEDDDAAAAGRRKGKKKKEQTRKKTLASLDSELAKNRDRVCTMFKMSFSLFLTLTYFAVTLYVGFEMAITVEDAPFVANYAGMRRMVSRLSLYQMQMYAAGGTVQGGYNLNSTNIFDVISEAEDIQNALLLGDPNRNLTGYLYTNSDPLQTSLLFEDGCVNLKVGVTLEACATFDNKVVANGLQSLIRYFGKESRILAEYIVKTVPKNHEENPSEFTPEAISRTIANWPGYTRVCTLEDKYMQKQIGQSIKYYVAQAKAIIDDEETIQIWALVLFLVSILLYDVMVLQKMVNYLDNEIKRTRSLLLMIPDDILQTLPQLRRFLAKEVRMSQSTGKADYGGCPCPGQ